MRPARIAAGALVAAAAGMTAAALGGGGDDGDGGRRGRAAATPAPARDGLTVWIRNGCGSCHTLAAANATGTLGPDLASSLKGMPEAYVREGILAPAATAAPGYEVGAMPEDYAARIPAADLQRLVAFLRASAR